MKKYLSVLLAGLMCLSMTALAACSDDEPNNSSNGSNQSSTPGSSQSQPTGDTTQPNSDNTTATTDQTSIVDPPVDPFDAQFHGYLPIDNLDQYKTTHINLISEYFDQIVMSQSIFSGNDWTQSEDEEFSGLGKEDAPNLFDGDKETKWCCGRDLVEFKSAIVFALNQPANVTAYSLTTGNDNVEWPSRNPVQWRLYATNTLPETVITDTMEDGATYLESGYVPEGWTLIDAVNAGTEENPMLSQMPDTNLTEVGFELAKAGSYQYFMFLIDYCEEDDVTFQLSELTLYGTAE